MTKSIVKIIEYAYVKSFTLTKQYNGEDGNWELILELQYEAQDAQQKVLECGNSISVVISHKTPITDLEMSDFLTKNLIEKIKVLKKNVANEVV